ncbi:MAG: DUF5716 family protein [Eubacteriales bacterium]
MKIQSKIVVGFDLGNYTSQISYSFLNGEEPVTLSWENGKQEYHIPTVLGKKAGENTWFHGVEAWKLAEQKEVLLVDGLLQHALADESIHADGIDYKASDLLTLYLKKCLEQIRQIASFEQIQSLVITVHELNENKKRMLSKVTASFPLRNQVISFRAREDAFFYYSANMIEQFWQQQLLLVDGTEEYLKVYRLEVNPNVQPMIAFVDKVEYPHLSSQHKLGIRYIEENQEKREYELMDTIGKVLDVHSISTIFFMGDEFIGDWFQGALQTLSQTHRVFIGNNLFSKGATYLAKDLMLGNLEAQKYAFLGNDTLKSEVSVLVRSKDSLKPITLVEAGRNWYEVTCEMDFILDDAHEITFFIESFISKKKSQVVMRLDGLPNRPKRTTLLHIKIHMIAETMMRVHIQDQGFGELFRSTELSWDEEISLD